MGTICQQCGGKGFENAFVYCVTCLNFVVHRYCLPKLPKTFDEFVHWYCEDCELKSAKHSPPQKPCSCPTVKWDHLISNGVRVKKSRRKKNKKNVSCLVLQTEDQGQRSGPVISKGVRVKKSRNKLRKKNVSCSVPQTEDQGQQGSPSQQTCDADINIHCTMHAQQSSLSKEDSDAHAKLQLTEHAQLASDCSDQNLGLKLNENSVAPLVGEREEQKCQSGPSPQPCEAQTELALCVTSYSPLTENTIMQHSVAETEEQTSQSSPSQLPCVENTELALCVVSTSPLNELIQPCSENYGNDLELEKRRKLTVEGGREFCKEAELVGIDDSQTVDGDLSNTLEQNYQLHAQPFGDRIWRGSFNIRKKVFGIFDGVVAHLSNKACQKVCEEAALLPAVLNLEMLPKSSLWPESFQESEPCDERIGLYFFPESKWYEWVFDCLVDDMIKEELAMRAIVKNAELLVFPSSELPIHYWKLQGKYYLWGVFRKKHDSFFHLAEESLLVENSNTQLVVYSSSADGVGTEGKRNLTKTKSARSPLSPLSNSCSSG